MSRLADAAVQLMSDVEIVDADTLEVVDNDTTKAIWAKIQTPNDQDNFSNFTKKAIQSLAVVGDGFIYRTVESFPELAGEVFILPSHKMSIQLGNIEQPIKGYQYDGYVYNGTPSLTTTNTIMFALANLDDKTFFGLSPLTTVLKDLHSMDAGKLLRYEQLKQGGPQNILTPKELFIKTSQGEHTTNTGSLADTIQRILNSKKNKNLVLTTPMDNISLGTTAVSLGAEETITSTKEEICNAYNFPVDLLFGRSTYSNQKEARLQLYLIALPYLEVYLDALAKVFNMPNRGLVFQVNKSTIMRLQEDLTVEMNARNGITTINEQRAVLGLPPVDNGDVVMVEMNKVPLDQAIEPITITEL